MSPEKVREYRLTKWSNSEYSISVYLVGVEDMSEDIIELKHCDSLEDALAWMREKVEEEKEEVLVCAKGPTKEENMVLDAMGGRCLTMREITDIVGLPRRMVYNRLWAMIKRDLLSTTGHGRERVYYEPDDDGVV